MSQSRSFFTPPPEREDVVEILRDMPETGPERAARERLVGAGTAVPSAAAVDEVIDERRYQGNKNCVGAPKE